MAVLLYGLDLSHYVIKTKKILEYKGIPFEYEYAPYHDRQDLIRVSGQDYVPYLLWEDEGVAWDKIPDFLETKKPAPTIYPNGSRNLARMLENYAHDVIEEMGWRVCAPDARKTFKDPREAWVFEELQVRKRGDMDEMATQKPKHLKGFIGAMQATEARLGDAPFILGNEPSLADFAMYGALHVFPYTGNELPRELPHVRKWFSTVAALGKK